MCRHVFMLQAGRQAEDPEQLEQPEEPEAPEEAESLFACQQGVATKTENGE